MKVRITNAPFSFDGEAIKKDLFKELEALWDGAIRAFLRAVALEGVVKVDSGMSRASLLPLARVVKMFTEVRSSISTERNPRPSPRPYYNASGRRDGLKSIAHGEELGKKAYKVLYGTPKNPKFVFDFEIVVFQYFLHENGVRNQQAWKSLEVGRIAFLSYLEENLAAFSNQLKFTSTHNKISGLQRFRGVRQSD